MLSAPDAEGQKEQQEDDAAEEKEEGKEEEEGIGLDTEEGKLPRNLPGVDQEVIDAMEEELDEPGDDDDDESYEEKKPKGRSRRRPGARPRGRKRRKRSSGDDSDSDDGDSDDDDDDGSGSGGSDDGGGDSGTSDESDDGGKTKKIKKAKAKKSQPGPVISNGIIDLPLGPVRERLTCPLCNGYFREPYTIAECLHTFCKSCLFFGFRNGYRRCPTCDTSLEPDPYKECLADRTLESIVDKLLPHLKETDNREERDFYARRGIKLKKEFAEQDRGGERGVIGNGGAKRAATAGEGGGKTAGGGSGKSTKTSGRAGRAAPNDDEMDFKLIPDENVERGYQMPPLEMNSLRASGHLKVAAVKKFLLIRLQLKASPASVEVCCNGDPLGDELSLTFVHRTRWMHPESELVLTFRFGEEGMF